jgi:hypothetical protein
VSTPLYTNDNYKQYAEIAEFCNLVKLLQRLVYYCPSKIKDRWNFWSFCRLAGRAVDSNNTPELRQVGIEMLLQFIEGLRPVIQGIEGDSKSDMIDGVSEQQYFLLYISLQL